MITLPASQDAVSLVDWLEASLMTQNADRISDAAIIDVFSEADFDDADGLLAGINHTLRARSTAIGASYPFRRDGLGYARIGSWKNTFRIASCCSHPSIRATVELKFVGGSANRPAELFETLASRAVEKYLGCPVIRIGAPRRKPVPGAFPAALEYAVKELGEIIGTRDLEKQAGGDDGVDLIGWRTFGDARGSQAIILAQCAIGNGLARQARWCQPRYVATAYRLALDPFEGICGAVSSRGGQFLERDCDTCRNHL